MIHQIFIGLLIFIVAVSMTMVGKGGGNFYVLILAMTDISMYNAAATGQFILFSASIAAMIIFQKQKTISWKLALIVGGLTAISAFGGGVFSHYFTGRSLKLIFACMLFIAGIVMLIKFPGKKKQPERNHKAMLSFKSENEIYRINMLIVVPVTILTGLSSGMVGVSGGSFLVPLMVLAAGVPMQTAVGTASILIAATAFMGFSGHAIQGDFNPSLAVPLAIVTIAGGIIGSKFALKSKPKNLKRIFAYTNWLAAILMVVNIIY
jgi:hypothetical protein